MYRLTVTGADETARLMRNLAEAIETVDLAEAARVVHRQAVIEAPSDTGELRRHLEVQARRGAPAIVTSRAPHSRPVHNGRRRPTVVAPNPYLDRASTRSRPAAVRAGLADIEKAIDRLDRF